MRGHLTSGASRTTSLASGGAPLVPMVKAPHFGELHDGTVLRTLDASRRGGVLLQGEMRARAVTIGEVGCEDATEVPLAEHDDVVETHSRRMEPMRRST
jgi:hypothetical protein